MAQRNGYEQTDRLFGNAEWFDRDVHLCRKRPQVDRFLSALNLFQVKETNGEKR